MLETSNLARNSHSNVVSENMLFSALGPLNFADFSIFFAKTRRFLAKTVPLLKALV